MEVENTQVRHVSGVVAVYVVFGIDVGVIGVGVGVVVGGIVVGISVIAVVVDAGLGFLIL